MARQQNRNKHPDIARFVDEVREYMTIEKIVFPYYPDPWTYWWTPSPNAKRKK